MIPRRDIVALMLAPIAGVIVGVALSIAAFLMSDRIISTGPDPYTPDGGWGAFVKFSLRSLVPQTVLIYLCTLFMGFPTHLVLRARGLTSLTSYAIAGAAWPVLVTAAYLVFLSANGDGVAYPSYFGEAVLHLTIVGAAISATYWAIAVRRPTS